MLHILNIQFPISNIKSLISKRAGFTLIELMITVTIMTLLVGVGIVGYVQFSERQTVIADAQTVQNMIQSARQRALIGDLGNDNCANLDAYRVEANAGASVVQLVVFCRDAGNNPQTYVVGSEILDSRVTFDTDISITFNTLSKGVEGYGPVQLNSETGHYYRFDVSQAGAISAGSLEQGAVQVVQGSPTPIPTETASPTTTPSPTATPTPVPTPSNCGNGTCNTGQGETKQNCPQDCCGSFGC